VPHVAIVVTRLDQVNERDRARVVQYIAGRVRDWGAAVEVWTSHEGAGGRDDPSMAARGPAAMREAIGRWAADPRRVRRRIGQAAHQLAALMETVRAVLTARRQAACADRSARDAALQNARLQIDTEGMKWEELRTEMDRRSGEAHSRLRDAMNEAAGSLKQR